VEPTIRAARQADAEAVTPLLYASAEGMYDRFAGGSRRAHNLLRRAFEVPGNQASVEVITVAELDGRVAAAMAAFPVEESPARASAFLRIALKSIPPWRWPGALRVYSAGGRVAPSPPRSALYIDALATEESLRRRGAARALLEEAERTARRVGCPTLALDTSLDNRGARSLYVGAGFEEVAYRSPGRRFPGYVALVKELA
jgi:GNAT superfamily N-acetyltransferase